MVEQRSPFLVGALTWISGDGDVASCDVCQFDWSAPSTDSVDAIAASPNAYSSLLDGRDGMAPAADGGWNATGYVWHRTDLARSWSERWVQIRVEPGSLLAGWDPDVLAEARNYRGLPTVPALWALDRDVATFVQLSQELDHATTFEHGDWGTGNVGDATRWLAHEFTHHQIDVAARAT